MRVLKEVLDLSIQYLKEKKISSSRLVAETLLASVLDIARMDLYLQFDRPLAEEELVSFRALLRRAGAGEPFEYILSRVAFYGLEVLVSPHVLIPRQETEILVDFAAKLIESDEGEGKHLWDVCSGSGCIGLSLKKKFPEISVTLSDISQEALVLSRKSAQSQGVEAFFLQGDLLEPFEGKKADYVFCNPPYISLEEYEQLDGSVKGYEPKGALIGGVSGLEFYERLAEALPRYLNPKARVFLEIGHRQGNAVREIFSDPYWKQKTLLQDWSGKDRFFFLEIE